MSNIRQFTAIIEREDDGYVALCPELDIASQGDTVEQARANLIEALELFFEVAEPSEIERRLSLFSWFFAYCFQKFRIIIKVIN
ncbi:type II toxin-antitoxin system HicB family antitoxin [Microseira sp. BLCC-F43]|uniref:type II toxin-antitoxin system HicB family antitoxin n=1 Tax=Microseira sp. BLCC-F43 TaxID=3153602 RepID=UPI0035B6E914